jgi:hypothetical protein
MLTTDVDKRNSLLATVSGGPPLFLTNLIGFARMFTPSLQPTFNGWLGGRMLAA